MIYCVGVELEEGRIPAGDSRTHAAVDNYAKFCKMIVFERAGDRALVLPIGVMPVVASAAPQHRAVRRVAGSASSVRTVFTLLETSLPVLARGTGRARSS